MCTLAHHAAPPLARFIRSRRLDAGNAGLPRATGLKWMWVGREWVSAKLETWLPGADTFKKTELLLVEQELQPNAEETFGHGGDA